MNEIQKSLLLSQLQRVEPKTNSTISPVQKPLEGDSFDKVLERSEIQISKHAEKRLHSRNIELSVADKVKLQDAMGSLQKKGARDSLVLMGELALIVNVPSKTVVTAMAKDQMKEQVFTNIDSTILV